MDVNIFNIEYLKYEWNAKSTRFIAFVKLFLVILLSNSFIKILLNLLVIMFRRFIIIFLEK